MSWNCSNELRSLLEVLDRTKASAKLRQPTQCPHPSMITASLVTPLSATLIFTRLTPSEKTLAYTCHTAGKARPGEEGIRKLSTSVGKSLHSHPCWGWCALQPNVDVQLSFPLGKESSILIKWWHVWSNLQRTCQVLASTESAPSGLHGIQLRTAPHTRQEWIFE